MASHLTVSVELISFMKWMLKHKQPQLKQLVEQALQQGLRKDITAMAQQGAELATDELYTVVDQFLSFIEDEIIGHMSDQYFHTQPQTRTKEQLYKSLTPHTQAQLHNFSKNKEVITASMNETAQMLDESTNTYSEQAKKHALMRSLLNNWSPDGESEVN